MSLDLYLKSAKPVRHRGTGVFARRDGRTRELATLDEVREHFPDADLSDIRMHDYEDHTVLHVNMTHNLILMALHVPIAGTEGVFTMPAHFAPRDGAEWVPEPLSSYYLLWSPENNPLLKSETLHMEDDGDEWEEDVTHLTPELVRQLMAVHHYVANHRSELERYNPDNGWGDYDLLLDNVRNLLMAVLEIPVEQYGDYYILCSI